MFNAFHLLITLFIFMFFSAGLANSKAKELNSDSTQVFKITLEVPRIETDAYFRPYVVVWLETAKREPIQTLALWYQTDSVAGQEDGGKWLKDLRQWWRKIGRDEKADYDSVTGATRRPGRYSIVSQTQLNDQIASGNYFINFEAAREEGGRTFHRVPLTIQKANLPQTIILPADNEFGKITILLESQ